MNYPTVIGQSSARTGSYNNLLEKIAAFPQWSSFLPHFLLIWDSERRLDVHFFLDQVQSLLYSILLHHSRQDTFWKVWTKDSSSRHAEAAWWFSQVRYACVQSIPEIEIAFDIHYSAVQFKVYAQSFFDTAKYITPQIKIQTGRRFGIYSVSRMCSAPAARPRKLLWRQIADAIHDEPIRYWVWRMPRHSKQIVSSKPTACAASTDTKRLRRHEIARKVGVEFGRFRRFERLSMLRLCIPKLPEPSKPLKTSHYFFVSLHVAATRRFVSAASDETRKGETEMDAPPKAKP